MLHAQAPVSRTRPRRYTGQSNALTSARGDAVGLPGTFAGRYRCRLPTPCSELTLPLHSAMRPIIFAYNAGSRSGGQRSTFRCRLPPMTEQQRQRLENPGRVGEPTRPHLAKLPIADNGSETSNSAAPYTPEHRPAIHGAHNRCCAAASTPTSPRIRAPPSRSASRLSTVVGGRSTTANQSPGI